MLEIRLNCEHCDRGLPPDSMEAMICTYECTFCVTCVDGILENVCPNCGGGFERRPVRPKAQLKKYPPSEKHIFKPIDFEVFEPLKRQKRGVNPEDR